MKKRSRLSLAVAAFVAVAVSFILTGCGKNFYFAGRTLPPSGLTQRVLVAVDNPVGSLQFMDAFYDIRHPLQQPEWAVFDRRLQRLKPGDHPKPAGGAGWSGVFLRGRQPGVDQLRQEKLSSNVVSSGSISTSIFGSRKEDYFVAANQNSHAMVVDDVSLGSQLLMNIPGSTASP